jgi:hypothetical protein
MSDKLNPLEGLAEIGAQRQGIKHDSAASELPAPTGSEFRAAGKVLRWGLREARREMEALPWWKRFFASTNSDELSRLIVLCESEADDRTPNEKGQR